MSKIHQREPVTIEKRKPLTPKQRFEMFLDHNELCCICSKKITEIKWIDEHIIPLAMGGTNDMVNRAPAHIHCAKEKTSKEAPQRAKAKRLAGETCQSKPKRNWPSSQPIRSQGFGKQKRKIQGRKFDGKA